MTTHTTKAQAGSLRGDDTTYATYQRPGIRLSEPIDRQLYEMTHGSYQSYAQGLQWFDKAHLVMLAEEGIISPADAAACLRVLRAADEEGVEQARTRADNSLHGGETLLIRSLGMEVGGRIHAGRSSWDLSRVAHRLTLRDALRQTMTALNNYRATLLNIAAQHLDSVMPYYTHGQQAQPTTFGHQLHAFVCAAERDFERLMLAYAHTNVSPAGAAAGTASRFPINRERVAQLLGFDAVATNTRDISVNMDHEWEIGAALAFVMRGLDSLADELILWMGNELDMVQLADRFCTTSSIMMQKRNPRGAEVVQAIGERIIGRLPTSHSTGSLRTACKEVEQALHLTSRIVESLKINSETMRRRAEESWGQASDLAAVLCLDYGLSWRMAHQIVAIMVRLAEEEEIAPGTASAELLDRAAFLFLGERLGIDESVIARAMDPAACIAQRTATGSPGIAEMERQISASRQRLAVDSTLLAERQGRLTQAAQILEDAVDRILSAAPAP